MSPPVPKRRSTVYVNRVVLVSPVVLPVPVPLLPVVVGPEPVVAPPPPPVVLGGGVEPLPVLVPVLVPLDPLDVVVVVVLVVVVVAACPVGSNGSRDEKVWSFESTCCSF